MHKQTRNILLAILVGIVALPVAVSASAWDSWVDLNVTKSNVTDYRHLGGSGSVVYYRVVVTNPTTARFIIRTSRNASKLFAPQIVVFQSSEGTYGPILPIEQPPQTMAIVYGRTSPQVSFDAGTQTVSTTCLSQSISFSSIGVYLVAVYNAGSQPGAYKLIVNPSSTIAWGDAFTLPKTWAQDQLYAGFGWLTLITPTILLLIGWLVYLRLDHHQLHPHKTYNQPAPVAVPPSKKPARKKPIVTKRQPRNTSSLK
jgi:hypothetical protein